jgi:hypothetical protein
MSMTPAPPPAGSSPPTLDFGRCFTFVGEDPDWAKKVLIGGAFTLAASFLVGLPFVAGYVSRTFRAVARGDARPLPEWDDLGGLFWEGLRLVAMTLVYSIGSVLLVGLLVSPLVAAMVFTGFLAESDHAFSRGIGNLSGLVVTLLTVVIATCLTVILVAVQALLPAAATRLVQHDRFGAAFEVRAVLAFVRANLANYLVSLVVYIVAAFLAQFGIVLCCIGVFPATFWAYLTIAYGLGETVRLHPSSV